MGLVATGWNSLHRPSFRTAMSINNRQSFELQMCEDMEFWENSPLTLLTHSLQMPRASPFCQLPTVVQFVTVKITLCSFYLKFNILHYRAMTLLSVDTCPMTHTHVIAWDSFCCLSSFLSYFVHFHKDMRTLSRCLSLKLWLVLE